MSLVSIVIINYKNYLDTIECISSLLKIDHDAYQIIVIDNNSPNDSFVRIKKWLKAQEKFSFNWDNLNIGQGVELSKPVPFISYVFNGTEFVEKEKQLVDDSGDKVERKDIVKYPIILVSSYANIGFSGANNLGIKFALKNNTTNFFWFLNNDTVVEKRTLRALVETINKDERIGAVGSKLLYYYRSGYIQCLGGNEIKYSYSVSKYQGCKDFCCGDKEIKGYISGASFFIKSEIIERVGLWDENFFMSVEDVDYSFRINKSGYKLYVCGGSRVYHKDGASTKTEKKTMYFLGHKTVRVSFNNLWYYDLRNWIYFNKKHRNAWYKIFYYYFFLPFYFLMILIFIITFDDYKWGRIRLVTMAFWDGLTNKLGALT